MVRGISRFHTGVKQDQVLFQSCRLKVLIIEGIHIKLHLGRELGSPSFTDVVVENW